MNREPLDPGRWHRIEEVFQASIDLPPDQREALLDETCGDDPQLRDEVESLLSRVSPDSPLIEGIIDEATADLCDSLATLHKRSGSANS
jgi:hypothetical protein